MISIAVETRDKKLNNEALRKKGTIPAVYYGRKEKSTPIAISLREFEKVFKEAGESTVVRLKSKDEELDALIHDVDFDPVSGAIRHADFYVFEKGQKMEVDVPLEFVGEAPAVKDLGGILIKVLHEVKVKGEPKNLPHDIKVDISSLVAFDSVVLAKDLVLPEGVELMEKPEEVVAAASEPKADEPEEPTEAPDLSSIEVEEKGKKEEEGAEAAAGAAGEADKK